MRILFLGGTVFLGRHLVEAALGRGHTVTLFHRGRSNPDLFAGVRGVERVLGDRDGGLGGLDALDTPRWDAVIDTSGYVPRVVGAAATRLAGSVDHYTFISSVSVYGDLRTVGVDETSPVATLEDPATEEVTGATYGALKARCEQVVEQALPDHTLVVRPGLIVGPYDPTDRFTYWVWRLADGGSVLAPGRPERLVRWIDARDLAAWTLDRVEAGTTGVFNVDGPAAAPVSMWQLLASCRNASGTESELIWVDEEFLREQGVAPWSELPLWIPESDPESAGWPGVSIERALAAGLGFRPLDTTVQDTLAWTLARPADRTWRAGLRRERESELLAAWRATRQAG
jgi:2'-hydroxyisoflavone reductase